VKLIESFLINNDCYKSGKKITPKGLMLHSIGCNQPSAQVIIRNWNKPGVRKCIHGFIEPNGDVYHTLPWTMRGWHAGGKANDSYIGVEMTEPATIKYGEGSQWIDLDPATTKKHVLATYNVAVDLFTMLCKQFKLDPITAIISHSEGHKKGIASNHGDVEHIWRKFGFTMDKFRQDVKAGMKLTFTEALNIIDGKVDIDVKYWQSKERIDTYFDDLIIKIATKWQKG
jgi:hypothetical protein